MLSHAKLSTCSIIYLVDIMYFCLWMGPHAEAEVLKEVEEDDDELPSATSPSEEVEEDDEDEEPL